MNYTEDNIEGLTFKLDAEATIFIIDNYNNFDIYGYSKVDGWSIPSILNALNNGEWIPVQYVNGYWIETNLKEDYDIF